MRDFEFKVTNCGKLCGSKHIEDKSSMNKSCECEMSLGWIFPRNTCEANLLKKIFLLGQILQEQTFRKINHRKADFPHRYVVGKKPKPKTHQIFVEELV